MKRIRPGAHLVVAQPDSTDVLDEIERCKQLAVVYGRPAIRAGA